MKPAPRRIIPTRASVTTIRADGSRPMLHPADVRGRWLNVRRIVAAALVAVLVALPVIPVGGHPAVFLDIAHRRFHLFGGTFAFQDLWLGFFLLSGMGFMLYAVTAVLGRIWCGWTCPHTVFMEHLFRPIERLIDGDPQARRRLEQSPWTPVKVAKRVVKHALFIAVSFLIVHLILAYFVSLPGLWELVTQAPGEHMGLFVFATSATGILYFHFAWFREQLCLIVCPYGRLQSALIDDDSLVVGYDPQRGEPRGPVHQAGAGDCVDCLRCVQVCPTGIDIRHGLQMECVGCTACIDACDEVLDRVKRPRGLIRYDSLRAFGGEKRRFWRPRLAVYAVLLAAGVMAFTFALQRVAPFHASVLRMQGAPYYRDGGIVRNQFEVRLINKTDHPMAVTLEADSAFPITLHSTSAQLAPLEEVVIPLIITAEQAAIEGSRKLEIRTIGPEGRTLRHKVDFLAPGAWAARGGGR